MTNEEKRAEAMKLRERIASVETQMQRGEFEAELIEEQITALQKRLTINRLTMGQFTQVRDGYRAEYNALVAEGVLSGPGAAASDSP